MKIDLKYSAEVVDRIKDTYHLLHLARNLILMLYQLFSKQISEDDYMDIFDLAVTEFLDKVD